MPAGQLHGIVHAAGPAACADPALVDARLSDEPHEGRIKIAGPFFVQLPLHVWLTGIETRSAAFAEASVINRQCADACGAELLRDRLPGGTRRDAHVHQQHRRTWSCGSEVGRLQACAVGRDDVHVAPDRRGCSSSRNSSSSGRKKDQQEHQRFHAQILRLSAASRWADVIRHLRYSATCPQQPTASGQKHA